MNDAKVAIELEPHFPKAFVRGKSFNSYKTFKSLVSDTTDVWGYKLWTYGIPQGGGGGTEDFWGDLKFLLKREKGDLPKFLTGEGGRVAIFFLLLSKKEALFLDFFFK